MDVGVFRDMLAEAGQAAGIASIHEVEPDLSWVAIIDDHTALVLEWREAERRIVLESDVGLLAQATDAERLLSLMRYNAAWRETGGLRLAVSPDNTVTLLSDLPRDGMDTPWLAGVFEGFVSALNAWRAAFDEGTATHDATRSAAPVPQQWRA